MKIACAKTQPCFTPTLAAIGSETRPPAMMWADIPVWNGSSTSNVTFSVGNDDLPQVDQFVYFGSILSLSSTINDEINNRICQATGAFDKVSRRVFLNRDLTANTKIDVYSAIYIFLFLYGCKTWTQLKHRRKKRY